MGIIIIDSGVACTLVWSLRRRQLAVETLIGGTEGPMNYRCFFRELVRQSQRQYRRGGAMNFFIVDAAMFIAVRDLVCDDKRAFLTLYTAGEYYAKQTRLYLSADQLSGFGVNPNGEIISVFSLIPGRGQALTTAAVRCGGTRLDCLGEHLRALYESCGLRVVEILAWAEEYAPEGWDYARYGRPNFYAMTI
ncbi:MAG: hypothetical protein HYV32_00240 [Candidatus Kerfeldbacteria bacterium]|nr:hypothetical protein [Candidatus Kerfeldbacteria bacterium]